MAEPRMSQETLEKQIDTMAKFGLPSGSVRFLADKGFDDKEFTKLGEALSLPDETFAQRRKKGWIDTTLDDGDSIEITSGRYRKYVSGFGDISSEQALVQGRFKFAVEYMVGLADVVAEHGGYERFIPRAFSSDEKQKLRSIYTNFTTKDFIAAKIIEDKTGHDVVAANTWVTIRGQQLGIDDDLMRRVVHFCRTSADSNTNVIGELYSMAVGKWVESQIKLINTLSAKAKDYKNITCVAETHGQDAQLTTLGHIYANLAEQIKMHIAPMLQSRPLLIDGKIAGAIGTDVDISAALPDIDMNRLYKHLVKDTFGLNYVDLGNDQDCTNASISQVFDSMSNVNLVIKKAATDTWIYASRAILAKKTKKGESGSSAMPQKANPFFAESAEALVAIVNAMFGPIKENIVAYREQGDLRRSIAMREAFHPIMLSIIATERLIGEMNKYSPNIAAIEGEVYSTGPQIISSALNNYLRTKGIADAYDRVKDIVMKPFVKSMEITTYINTLVSKGELETGAASEIKKMLHSVMDEKGNIQKLREYKTQNEFDEAMEGLSIANGNDSRMQLLGTAVRNTERMIANTEYTLALLQRYVKTAGNQKN